MKQIELTRGMVALVDDDQYDVLIEYSWHAIGDGIKMYAARRVGPVIVWMHREILKPPVDMQCDHIDGDYLNNQRHNLRIATQSQNSTNKDYPRGISGYIGVHFDGSAWRGKVTVNYKQYHTNGYDTPEEAAIERDKLARQLQGTFARLNFP